MTTLRLYSVPRAQWAPIETLIFNRTDEFGFIAVMEPGMPESFVYEWQLDDPTHAFEWVSKPEGPYVRVVCNRGAVKGGKATLVATAYCSHGFVLRSQTVELIVESAAVEALTDDNA